LAKYWKILIIIFTKNQFHGIGMKNKNGWKRPLTFPWLAGEEEFGIHGFRYLIGNEVFQILQPDLFILGV
jgi:hypothetical protein